MGDGRGNKGEGLERPRNERVVEGSISCARMFDRGGRTGRERRRGKSRTSSGSKRKDDRREVLKG